LNIEAHTFIYDCTQKKGTKIPEVKHTSSPKFFYLGLPNSVLKSAFSNVCGLPLSHGMTKRAQVSQLFPSVGIPAYQ
jgi:hypothetical protein